MATDDVPAESLQNLLTSVRSTTSPLGGTNFISHLNRKDVIEIQGPSIGKTHLLMHFIITCITPRHYLSVDIGGWDKAAIVLDADHTFDVRRVRQLLSTRLSRLLAPTSLQGDAIDQLVHRILPNLHVFRPTSSFHLALMILNMANYHSTNLPNTDIGLVAIDSVSAFYWQDRFYAEQLREHQTSLRQNTSPGIEHVLKALESFRQSHGPVIIMTNWGLNLQSKTSPFYKQHVYPLHMPFNQIPDNTPKPVVILPLTYHITLRSTAKPTIRTPADFDAAHSQPQAPDVVEALVRTVGSNVVGKFMFRITDKDIEETGKL